MSLFQEYIQPVTIDEAVKNLSDAPGSVAVIAGGTDLLLDIRQGRHQEVDRIVDISGVGEMQEVALEENYIYLGAAVTHKQIITHPLLQEHAQCVVEGCGLIGGPQVRNVATIGGNVSHALPAGDGTISLLALDTEVRIASLNGIRCEPLIEIFAGPGKVTFNRNKELVIGFRFPARDKQEGSAFYRVMRPQGVAIAILNMAGWVKLDENEKLIDIRISCGPAGPRPFRAKNTEKFIKGNNWDEKTYQEACLVLDGEVSLRTSAHRATKEYRHLLLPVLLKNVLDSAVERAKL
ncbi:MAG: FAD binding domain-containing protein [Anaerolineales bacterium]|nr:FAD binding domain-containing protein [Anaerolineales bacterium]